MKNFYRIAALTPEVKLGHPMANAEILLAACREACAKGASICVTPELALTGASCGDLFHTTAMKDQTLEALEYLCEELPKEGVFVIGFPLYWKSQIFSCAVVIQNGEMLGYVPKATLTPAERRIFTSAEALQETFEIDAVPIGMHLLFDACHVTFAVTLCSNLWSLNQTAEELIAGRPHVVLNLASEIELAGQASLRRDLVKVHSGRLACAYVYVNAGKGESTTDTVYSGHTLMANNGRLIAERQWSTGITYMDFNPRWVEVVQKTALQEVPYTSLPTITGAPFLQEVDGRFAGLDANPFVPADEVTRWVRCREILQIQVAGLARRFTHIKAKRLVIGLSGGLDSTLALLVCDQMCKQLHLPPTTILGITMPGFGTSRRTRGNVDLLAERLGIELREIPIAPQVELHFKDIQHDPNVQDVTYENAQARARTFILMDLANQENGLQVGTGDLSEIALGWSTYNGDHMSMYSVNGGVPKTLMRACVESIARESTPELADVLRDICATPVSPELLPGEQHTESLVGSYELHDFFLYYFMKYRCTREELAELAHLLHPTEDATRTLDIFCRRMIQQQFKRSASPDGPKVGTIGFSPRGDWMMPSDAIFTL